MRNHSEPGRAAAHHSGVLNFELTAITGWDFAYFPLGKKWCVASVGTMVCRLSGWTEGQTITGCKLSLSSWIYVNPCKAIFPSLL